MNTPVLILAHDRPELLRKCLDQLKSTGSTNLYASVDGPSCTKEIAHEKVVASLSEVISEDRLNLIPTNLGCEKGVLNAIDWFFTKVEKGIIIEEDVLISKEGLQFLDQMLLKYQNEPSVFMAGAHLPTGNWNTDESHFFSRVGHIWGWATWKDRWEKHDPIAIKPLFDTELIADSFGQTRLAEHFKLNLEASLSGHLDTWDFQWNMTMLANNGVCVLPNSNQIENIGIAPNALHTKALHQGVCNGIQNSISGTSESQPISADREYEHEWFRRLKGETKQLKISHDLSTLIENSDYEGSLCLVNTTEIGGGAEKVCSAIFHSPKLTSPKLLVSVKKTDHSAVQQIEGSPSLFSNLFGTASDFLKRIDGADVVHLHNIHGMNLNWNDLLKMADQTPVIWTLHDQWILGKNSSAPYREDDSIPKHKLAFIQHRNVHLVVPSLWLQDKVYWKTGKLPILIHNGIDTSIFKPEDKTIASKRLNLNPSKRRILFIAKNPVANPYKDFETLKAAWVKANETIKGEGIDLFCLGGKPEIEEFGDNHLTVVEPTENPAEVATWINACNLVVHASLNDNSPLSILESMACKTPVIATNVGGINELLGSGTTGILTKPKSLEDLTQSILSQFEKDNDSLQKADSAWLKVCSEHTLGTMTDAYFGLYSKVIR